MSYALSEALQAAVYARLTGDAALQELVGGAIHDAPPPLEPGSEPPLLVTLGEERVRDASTKTSVGAVHDFAVTVHARTEGFSRPKAAAAAVCDALLSVPLVLSQGHLVDLRMLHIRAERGRGTGPRRVELRFRAVLEQDF
ncbi:DUF3168 domain-containing protein [Halovulum dunhuangense]|uniref:DUF3168 domain-containing protein n=1 Tax=Halovulum dunhuangense TaxID=1505036 RepID=A0A849L5Y9_9RHOB|nr:DUF3168 domain-containing protein [Halovulum dunhuangense]NNU81908.1 DUF3168 domain-containing protein [Halovulum dunhuangense]